MPETLDGTIVDPFPRPGYNPDAPWVGDCDNETEQENARKVRWAMSMSIDRQGIVNNILGGLGRPAGPAEMSGVTFEKYFQDKWSVPYDPEMSRQYLSEAGHPRRIRGDHEGHDLLPPTRGGDGRGYCQVHGGSWH